MPDKKLTDNEIIKALECCVKETHTCLECPYTEFGQCEFLVMKDALDLINRLQAENERLKEKCEMWDKTVFAKSLEEWLEFCDNFKAEAYKECIEKAKNEIDSQSHSRSLEASGERFRIHKILDNLLKELVGGENGEEG